MATTTPCSTAAHEQRGIGSRLIQDDSDHSSREMHGWWRTREDNNALDTIVDAAVRSPCLCSCSENLSVFSLRHSSDVLYGLYLLNSVDSSDAVAQ
jgi:hypothetical protein